MGLIEDLRIMQEKLDKIPKPPKRIEVTKYMYQAIKNESDINELLYGKPISNYALPFGGVTVWVATNKEQEEWTEDEKKKQFKVVY